MHLDEENYLLLLEGAEFPGSEELANHLEQPCDACEAFLTTRSPGSLLKRQAAEQVARTAAQATAALAPPPPAPARVSRSMRTENLAVMLTDIKGYTERTSRQTRAQNERLLQLHEALLLPAFRAFDGIVRKSIGDAFLVTFESPTNAVLCGVAIQDRLYSFNQVAPEPDRFEVRVVVNQGEVRVEPRDVFGEPVNVAKGVEEQAEASEVTFTEAVYLVMNKAEVPSSELGIYALKGVAEQVRLFKVPRGARQADPAHAQLPFGGLGLARAPNLATPDLPSLERALLARQTRRAYVASARQFLRSPAGVKLVAGLVALAVLVGVVQTIHVLRTPPVEKALNAGEFAQARDLIDKMPDGAEKSFWQARLEAKQEKYPAAIGHYLAAAHGSKRFLADSIEQLGEIARDGDCSAKVKVADALGDLRDDRGRSILEDLSTAEPEKGALSALFGPSCDPASHAKAALKRLDAH